jgi:hypothetical protein
MCLHLGGCGFPGLTLTQPCIRCVFVVFQTFPFTYSFSPLIILDNMTRFPLAKATPSYILPPQSHQRLWTRCPRASSASSHTPPLRSRTSLAIRTLQVTSGRVGTLVRVVLHRSPSSDLFQVASQLSLLGHSPSGVSLRVTIQPIQTMLVPFCLYFLFIVTFFMQGTVDDDDDKGPSRRYVFNPFPFLSVW